MHQSFRCIYHFYLQWRIMIFLQSLKLFSVVCSPHFFGPFQWSATFHSQKNSPKILFLAIRNLSSSALFHCFNKWKFKCYEIAGRYSVQFSSRKGLYAKKTDFSCFSGLSRSFYIFARSCSEKRIVALVQTFKQKYLKTWNWFFVYLKL